MIRFNIF